MPLIFSFDPKKKTKIYNNIIRWILSNLWHQLYFIDKCVFFFFKFPPLFVFFSLYLSCTNSLTPISYHHVFFGLVESPLSCSTKERVDKFFSHFSHHSIISFSNESLYIKRTHFILTLPIY